MIKETVKAEVVRLRAEGVSYSKIAQALSIAKQSVVNILQSRKEEVTTLQAIELESILEEQRITYQGRITALSSLYRNLLESIEREDLSTVPLDKRITLLIKLSETLKDEVNSVSLEVYSREEQSHQREERLLVSDSLSQWDTMNKKLIIKEE